MKDVAGNAIGGFYGASTNNFAFGTATTWTFAPAPKQVKLVAANKLQFEVSTELSAVDATKFTLNSSDGGSPAVSSVTYVNNNGKATVTVTLNKDLAVSNTSEITSLAIADNGLTNSVGTKLSGGPVTFTYDAIWLSHFEDKLAAKITKVETKTINTIEVTFSELIEETSVAKGTFTVAGNTVNSIGWNGKVLTLTLKDAIATDAKPAVTQALALEDVAGNVLAAGTTVKATEDGIAPVVNSAVLNATTHSYNNFRCNDNNDGTFKNLIQLILL